MKAEDLKDRTVLVTGANGGLGEQFVLQALERGAGAVYAAARTPRDRDDPRVRPLALDITEPESVSRAVEAASDVDLLINNAGIAPSGDSIAGPQEDARRVFETNFFGTLAVANAFAPTLGANGGGTLLNVLSLAAWLPVPTAYAASKAAMWSATNGLRLTLRGQGTQVVGLLVGMVDTPMSTRWDVPKVDAADVVSDAYDGIAAGALEVLADEPARNTKSRLGASPEEFYPAQEELLSSFVA